MGALEPKDRWIEVLRRAIRVVKRTRARAEKRQERYREGQISIDELRPAFEAHAATLYELAKLLFATDCSNEALVLFEEMVDVDDQLIDMTYATGTDGSVDYLTPSYQWVHPADGEPEIQAFADRKIVFDPRGDFVFQWITGKEDLLYSYLLHLKENERKAVEVAFNLVLRRKALWMEAQLLRRDAASSGRNPQIRHSVHELQAVKTSIRRSILACLQRGGPRQIAVCSRRGQGNAGNCRRRSRD